MTIENHPLYLWINFGRNDLLIEKSLFDWKQWGLSDHGAPAIVTPFFTFWPWFSTPQMSEEAIEAMIEQSMTEINALKAKLSKGG